jgi:hypothetical protein
VVRTIKSVAVTGVETEDLRFPLEGGAGTDAVHDNTAALHIPTRKSRDTDHRKDAERIRGRQAFPPPTCSALAALTSGAHAAANEKGLQAVSINRVTVKVPDLHLTSEFYQSFFGMPLKQQSAKTHILGVGGSFFVLSRGSSHRLGRPFRFRHRELGCR